MTRQDDLPPVKHPRVVAHMVDEHEVKLDDHSRRLQLLERIIWVAGGIAIAIQYYPLISKLIN